MPPSAIFVTYRDMEKEVNSEFIAKARNKYGDRFTQLYFDSETLKYLLYDAGEGTPPQSKLKIYISGHGQETPKNGLQEVQRRRNEFGCSPLSTDSEVACCNRARPRGRARTRAFALRRRQIFTRQFCAISFLRPEAAQIPRA